MTSLKLIPAFLLFVCISTSAWAQSSLSFGARFASAKERHVELKRSLKQLQKAREDLMKASHDYGGHRTKAIQAIDTAIEEIKQGLAFSG